MSALKAVEPQETPALTGIQMTVGQCLDAEQGLANLAKLPSNAKIAYHLAKLLKLVREETKHFAERQEALIKEYGGKRPANPVELAKGAQAEITEVTPENREAYFARLKDELEMTVGINWTRLTLEEIEGLGNVRGEDVHRLGPLLADD